MQSNKTINFRIHHCRRDLNDSATTIKIHLVDNRFDDLRKAIANAENIFSLSATKYPPLQEFNMPPNYFDGNWNSVDSSLVSLDSKTALLKVKESIEKACRRSNRFLAGQEFSEQRQSLENIVDIIDSLQQRQMSQV